MSRPTFASTGLAGAWQEREHALALQHRPLHGEELRQALVSAGTIRPADPDRLRPLRLPPGAVVLRLDEVAHRVADARVRLAHQRKRDLEVTR